MMSAAKIGSATRNIPLARPFITEREIAAVVDVLRTPNLSLGPKLVEFETAFAAYCGTRHAVACANGTCGLHLLVRACGVRAGDEVVTTPFSFVASSNCALMESARPVFVDVDPDTWNIDEEKAIAAITPRTRAMIPVDVFGVIAEMAPLMTAARRHGFKVIEDSCEALGSRRGGRMAGAFGDAGVFGFYPNKQITTGEGGMIVTDDDETARLCRSMRNQGRDVDGGWLAHPRMGFNYRLCDINCALGLAQLQRIDEIIRIREKVAGWYRRRLEGMDGIRLQRVPAGIDVSWFVFVVRLEDDFEQADRDRILTQLRERGIGCSNYFSPIHLQPFYVEQFGYRRGDFPVCEALAARTIALPFHHELNESDIDYICESLRGLMERGS